MNFDVPQGFLLTTCQEYCSRVADGTHETPTQSEVGKRLVTSKNIKNGRLALENSYLIPVAEFEEINKRSKVDQWDILISMIGTVGEVCLIDMPEPDFAIKNVGLLKCGDQSRCKWLYYYLRSPLAKELLEARKKGTTQQYISLGEIRRFPVICPEVHDQMINVVSTLSALDDRITLLRETNATLEAIAQAIFKSWFVDFDPVRAKMEGRAPEGMDEATAALFPDSFEESELGPVPRGWRVEAVGDVVTVTDYVANGSFAALKENVTLLDVPSYALYVRTTDYNSGFSGGYRYVDKSAYDFLSKSSLDGSEVIISNVGDVGTVFRPPKWLGLPMTLGSNAIALKKSEMSTYLYFHFSGSLGQHDIKSIVTGSAQLKFNKTNFRALRLLMPNGECLAYFEGVANSLLSRIEVNLGQAQTLAALRDTLLPRLISGKLRLPEAENTIAEAIA